MSNLRANLDAVRRRLHYKTAAMLIDHEQHRRADAALRAGQPVPDDTPPHVVEFARRCIRAEAQIAASMTLAED